jgi:RNA polymerase sigma factor (sigma-70 family)
MDALAPIPRTGAIPRRLLRLRSDHALAERFAGGDESAFAVLFERHRRSVLAVCMGVLGSRQDAEDAAQDAFAALALSLRKGVPENLPAWLMRVARNAAIDVARRRRIDVRAEEGVPDRATSGEGMKAELESVMAGIRELPEAQRTALLMRELAGHSYREIATLLEVDEAAVHGLIARARISLRSYREADELSCAAARAALAAEPDGRRGDRTVRRHVRMCPSCRAYKRALRGDARALRGIVPDPAVPVASGGAVFGGLAAKGALIGGTVAQMTAACAVSVCAIGGVVLVAPHSHLPLIGRAGTSTSSAPRVAPARHHRRPSPAVARTGTAGVLPIVVSAESPRAVASPRAAATGRVGSRAHRLAGSRSDRHRWTRSTQNTTGLSGGQDPAAAQPAWGHPGDAAPQHGERASGWGGQANEARSGHVASVNGSSPGWNARSTGAASSGEQDGRPNGPTGGTRNGRSGGKRWSGDADDGSGAGVYATGPRQAVSIARPRGR